jgi:hypothetical protein
VFGNYALGDFIEVVAPLPISWWPQTVGWWWLAGIIAIVAARRGWGRLRRWYRNRYRREAETRLRQLEGTAGGPALVAEINRLLKLTAMVAYSRERVASLSGDGWVGFLNGHCPAAPFSPEQGGLLALAAYTGAATDADSNRQLLAASLAWVRSHEAPEDA